MNNITETSILGWHFARDDNRLGFEDGRKIVRGKTLTVEGVIVSCEHGLHASVRAFDALRFAQGCRLWRVELSGTVCPHGEPIDKYAASARTAIAGGKDATKLLRAFARQCAADVLHLWNAPPVVKTFLVTGRGRDAARVADWGAARDAAWDAARDAQAQRFESWCEDFIETGTVPKVVIP